MRNFSNDLILFTKFYVCRSLFISFLLFCINISSQNTVREIDRVQKVSHKKKIDDGDFYGAITQEQIAILRSRKLKYKRGEIRGYINIAQSFNMVNRYRESLKFLEKADLELKNFEDNELTAFLYQVYGANFCSLGLYAGAIKSFDRALTYGKKIINRAEKEKITYDIDNGKRLSFEFLGIMDSVYSNERKCMRLPKPMLYISIAQRQLKNDNIDSAEYYINKAGYLISKKEISMEEKSNVLRVLGQLCIEKKNYKISINYLLKSLAITQKTHLRKGTLASYKLIAEAYGKLENLEKENEFLTRYAQLSDSLRTEERKALNISIEKILIIDKLNKNNHTLIYLVIALIFAGFATILIVHSFYKKKQKQKDNIITQKNMETIVIKKELVNAYEDITNLVVKKDPSFINRFKQLHPEFYQNITVTYPGLTSNDMRLCALIKLNFSNKEIAEYTHISLRTVESKKHRLKKKLGFSTDIDLNKWITSQ